MAQILMQDSSGFLGRIASMNNMDESGAICTDMAAGMGISTTERPHCEPSSHLLEWRMRFLNILSMKTAPMLDVACLRLEGSVRRAYSLLGICISKCHQ